MTTPSSLQSLRFAGGCKLSLEDCKKARKSCFLLESLPFSLITATGLAVALIFALLDF